MTADRETLGMDVEQLTAFFPVEAGYFDFVNENDGRTTQYTLNAQSLRLFGLRNNDDDATDVRRAGAIFFQKKKWKQFKYEKKWQSNICSSNQKST